MSGKLFFIIFLFFSPFVFLSVFAADLNDVIESAIQKMQAQRKTVDAFAFKVDFAVEQHKRHSHTVNRIDHGNVLSERAHFEMEQLAAGTRLIATLLKAPSEVIKCIDNRTEEAQQENEKFLIERFYRPVSESERKLGNEQSDKMFDWVHRKTDLYGKYKKQYQEVLDGLKNMYSASQIAAATNDLFQKGEFFVKAAKEVIEELDKKHLDQLSFMDKSVIALRDYVRAKVDKTAADLEDCFFVLSPYYNFKHILNELM